MLRFLVLSFLVVASAVVHYGKCPDWLEGVENFNMDAFAGHWYVVLKLPYEDNKNGKCTEAEYKFDGERFKIRGTYVQNGVQYVVEGFAKPTADANNAAKLAVSLKYGGMTLEYPLLVMATDYYNYAILYNCIFDKNHNKHYGFAFVFSRTKKLEKATKSAIDDFLADKAVEIDSSTLLENDFSHEACKFTSTAPLTEPIKA